MCDGIHPFEKAGLGKAPFRYVGMIDQDIRYGERVIGSVGGVEITTKPGGTCAYCGTYIVSMFQVESSDGNRFHVGCDCIRKVGGEKLVAATKSDVKKAKEARENARIAEAKAALPTAYGLLSKPHPTLWRAQNGETMADWCRGMFSHAGRNGQLKAARVVEQAVAVQVEK